MNEVIRCKCNFPGCERFMIVSDNVLQLYTQGKVSSLNLDKEELQRLLDVLTKVKEEMGGNE